MKKFALLFALGLAGCVLRQPAHWRENPRPPEVPPTPTPPSKAVDEGPDPRYPSPESFAEAIRRLDTIQSQARDLTSKGGLFEVTEHAMHAEALAKYLPALADKDVVKPAIDAISSAGQLLVDISDLMTKAAKGERPDEVKTLLEEVPPQLDALQKYENLSDEYELKAGDLPESLPRTYKRALARARGVYNSLESRVRDGKLWEVPEVASHLKLVGQHVRRLAWNDIKYPIDHGAKEAGDAIRYAARTLRTAAEREDRTVAEDQIKSFAAPLARLDAVWQLFSGKSALEAGPKGPPDPPVERK